MSEYISRYTGEEIDEGIDLAYSVEEIVSNLDLEVKDNSITSSKIVANAVNTEKLANAAVTRAKLADDALYSPWINYSASNPVITITTEHIGKTIRTSNGSTDYVINISANTSIPSGAEIAVFRYWAKSLKIVFGADTKVCIEGETSYLDNPTINITNSFQMIALKKIVSDGGIDYWLVTGNVEVVE